MTERDQFERRRSPRVELVDHRLLTHSSAPVRVIDISLGGVLLACASLPRSGSRLSLPLGHSLFRAEIEVCQQSVRFTEAGGEHRVGAAFVRVDSRSRLALGQFLHPGRTPESD